MQPPVKKRRYDAPKRRAAAAQTREAILGAAKSRFEAHGWAGTTIAAVAADAEVSPKTIEATFATKAALLTAVVDYAIRGDTAATPMIERPVAKDIEAAADAAGMLDLHASYVVAIEARSAQIASVVESAAGSDRRVRQLWARMRKNRRFGASWAAELLLSKPGVRDGLMRNEAEVVFLVAIDWATYRTLTGEAGLDADAVTEWLRGYYRRMLLP
jgi:AcrR family transcriptional regulator